MMEFCLFPTDKSIIDFPLVNYVNNIIWFLSYLRNDL